MGDESHGALDENWVTYFAETDHRKAERFGIKAKDRSRHIYIIGKTGMGKTTLLENLAVQDIQNGEGLAFVDPHGSAAEKLLDYIPKDRIDDVLYFAPHDLNFPVSFNVMEDVGKDQRHLVANGLLAAFEKIWPDVWSARMEYILGNIILALLEYPDSTLLGVNRMLSDASYLKKVVNNITDPTVRSFWVDEYSKYTDRYRQEAVPAIQNKIGQFTANPLIRNIVGQPKSTFNIREMMDNKKIIIANLSKGRVGEINANLLGGMLITKMYLAAMSRADVPPQKMRHLPAFNLFVDEFQSFANKTFANILSESRKYKLNLVLAHQYIAQMPEEVRDAIFGNVGTLVAFRVGAFDAEVLEKEFAPTFSQQDIVNLGFAQIYLRLMIDGINSAPFSARTLPPIRSAEGSHRKEVIDHSRKKYALPRGKVEEDILSWYAPVLAPSPQGEPRRDPTTAQPQKERVFFGGFPKGGERTKSKSQGQRPEGGRHFSKPVPVQAAKPVSLSELNSKKERHIPKEEHMSELKSVLEAALKERSDEGKVHEQPKILSRESGVSKHAEEEKAHFRTEERKEISRDELKKMLEVPEE